MSTAESLGESELPLCIIFFFTGSQWANIGTLQAAAAGPGWYFSDNTNSEKKPKTEASRHRAFYSDKIGHFLSQIFVHGEIIWRRRREDFFFFYGCRKMKNIKFWVAFLPYTGCSFKKGAKKPEEPMNDQPSGGVTLYSKENRQWATSIVKHKPAFHFFSYLLFRFCEEGTL